MKTLPVSLTLCHWWKDKSWGISALSSSFWGTVLIVKGPICNTWHASDCWTVFPTWGCSGGRAFPNRNCLTGHMPGFWFNHFGAMVLRKVPQGSSLVAHMIKNLPASTGDIKRHRFNPWVGKIPWRRKLQPTPMFLPGIPWTEDPGGLQSMVLQRVRHD